MIVKINTNEKSYEIEVEELKGKKYKYFESLSGIEFNELDKDICEYILSYILTREVKVKSFEIKSDLEDKIYTKADIKYLANVGLSFGDISNITDWDELDIMECLWGVETVDKMHKFNLSMK